MYSLQLPFKFLLFSGICIPENWISLKQKSIRIAFSIICISLIAIQFLGEVFHLIKAETWVQFNERIYLIPTSAATLQKGFFFITHRKELINLDRMFLKNCCTPRNPKEFSILKSYDVFNRKLTIMCSILVFTTMAILISIPLLPSSKNNALPINVWLPYSINSKLSYWLTYGEQFLGIGLVAIAAIGSTMMVIGFMHRVCGQFELLSYRLHKLPATSIIFRKLKVPDQFIQEYENRFIKNIVQHHLYIFRLAERINEFFKPVIIQHFCGSALVVSTTIYQLSTRSGKLVEFLTLLLYLVCVLVEFLVYSWFGNEIKLESLNFMNTVYHINWNILDLKTKKDLALITLRSSKPIVMQCGNLIKLSLSSYINILKMSYSVFNILRKSSS